MDLLVVSMFGAVALLCVSAVVSLMGRVPWRVRMAAEACMVVGFWVYIGSVVAAFLIGQPG